MNENNNPYYQNMPDMQNTGEEQAAKKPSSALSIVALVLGIISMVTCLYFINIPLAIAAIIISIICLIKKYSRKGMAIAGVILGALSLAVSVLEIVLIFPFIKVLPDFYNDVVKIYKDYDTVIEEYDRTGELPDYMDKYYEGEVGEMFDKYFGGFDNFFDQSIRMD